MKRILTTFFAMISVVLLSAPALAECKASEGKIKEYDFTLDDDGNDVIRPYVEPRIVATNCLTGQAAKTTFRGVTANFNDSREIRKAIEAAEVFAAIGFTDSTAIKQLVDRVVALKAAEAARPKPKAEAKPAAVVKTRSATDWQEQLFGAEPKKK